MIKKNNYTYRTLSNTSSTASLAIEASRPPDLTLAAAATPLAAAATSVTAAAAAAVATTVVDAASHRGRGWLLHYPPRLWLSSLGFLFCWASEPPGRFLLDFAAFAASLSASALT
jgi:hypothetical protein